LFIQGGIIIPAGMKSAITTIALRDESFELIRSIDRDETTSGQLYLDDGVSIEQRSSSTLIHFNYNTGTLFASGNLNYEKPTTLPKNHGSVGSK
jgi:alpha-glucosidase